MGVAVSDTISDMAIEAERTTANSRKRRPIMPGIMRIGMKTAMSEMLIERTVKPISAAPRRAASIGFKPFSMCLVMFSITTIASSTTNPVAIASAISDRLSRLYPQRYMTPNVAISETGTETLGMNVAHPLRRKTNTTRMTSRIEMIMLDSALATEARIVMVRSMSIFRFTAGGSVARNMGSRALIRSTVSMMLALGWRLTEIVTAGIPRPKAIFRTSSEPSTTRPRSDRRTGALLR